MFLPIDFNNHLSSLKYINKQLMKKNEKKFFFIKKKKFFNYLY